MEKEKMLSELAMLKSQINPHVLFNNLNSIYSLSIRKSEETPKAIVMLSELMRYVLYDSSAEQISLDKEVEHLQNYIDLQKIRLKNNRQVTFVTEGELESKKIEPMLLEPFVENAFKHGDIFRKEGNICIRLKAAGKDLHFLVQNTVSLNGHVKDKHSGIGLKNIEKRLELLYPDRHQLNIEQNDDCFKVDLKLRLTHD
jgi:LytS/YehU family sensor histidine kinase